METVVRLGWALASSWLRWRGGALLDRLHPGAGRAARHERRQRRIGEIWSHHLGALKGPFVKAGQFLSLRVDLVPHGVAEGLAGLRENVTPRPFAEVRRVVEAELDGPLEQYFASFEETPLGAASIAQAHAARLADDTDVVVKVQYAWLADALPSDLIWLRRALRLVAGRARAHDAERLFEEFAAGLREELDFRREAEVAGAIARNLADQDDVVVPEVVPALSGRRVLTVRAIEALPVDDADGLRRAGVDPAEITATLARAYAKQVFVDGLFHADPHPGNLFVTPPSDGVPARVLFVDFGLSKRLDPELRREMRRGLFALVKRDPEAFVERMDAMGMIAPDHRADVRAAVGAMFDRIAAGGGEGPLGVAGDRVLSLKDEAKALLADTPGLQLPTDLLLYARTLSYLFALGDRLAPEVDLLGLSLPYLLRFLAEKEEKEG